ncbi:MAG: YggS family pyridoxal phosphate-dependent enzyme [Oscillospiraceae bacterium]|nr:YggS family pyridoxal phosphate-dependent enzyme [Oscillospiraceae bacterium]
MSLQENIHTVRENIAAAARAAGRDPADITLAAATKTQSSETIQAAIVAGITVCGENRVQEMAAHLADNAYEGARLHFIGHLQTNKVRHVVGRADLIESVDSLRLLEAINAQAEKLQIVQDILLEVNVAGEESKGGAAPGELLQLAEGAAALSHISLRGLMAIPPIAIKKGDNRKFFLQTYQLFVDIRTVLRDNNANMNCLSMGMSGDYEDAVQAGATMVRVGSALFGPRLPVVY